MWHGWTAPYVGAYWLAGAMSTRELHEHLTDSECLRAMRDEYVLALHDRYCPA